jgi:hypothetical protein
MHDRLVSRVKTSVEGGSGIFGIVYVGSIVKAKVVVVAARCHGAKVHLAVVGPWGTVWVGVMMVRFQLPTSKSFV